MQSQSYNQIFGYTCTRCGQYVQNALGGHICPSYTWPWTTQTPQSPLLDYNKLAEMVADRVLARISYRPVKLPPIPEPTSRDLGAE